jgi:hypothetical protein
MGSHGPFAVAAGQVDYFHVILGISQPFEQIFGG